MRVPWLSPDLEATALPGGAYVARGPGREIEVSPTLSLPRARCSGCGTPVLVTVTRLEARLLPPLDELLSVRLASPTGARGGLGIVELDDWLVAWSQDAGRLELLASEGAFEPLRELSPGDVSELRLDRGGLELATAGPARGSLFIGPLVGWADRVVLALRRASQRLAPPAWRAAIDAGWSRAAVAVAGSYVAPYQRIEAQILGARIHATAVPREDALGRWWTTCEVEVPGAVARADSDVVWSWHRGQPLPAIVAVSECRAGRFLALLARVHRVELRTGALHVWVDALLVDAFDVEAFVRACAAAAAELSSDGSAAPAAPYR